MTDLLAMSSDTQQQFEAFSSKLGYEFRDRGLLLQALRTPIAGVFTYEADRDPDANKKMAFVGEQVVYLVVVNEGYTRKFTRSGH